MLDTITSHVSQPVLVAVLAVAFSSLVSMFWSRSQLPLEGKNVFIGGGSQGLGLSVACLVARRGAHVTIVSRSQAKLDLALAEVEKNRKDPSQRLVAISADLISSEGTSRAFDEYEARNKVAVPDIVISCQGGAGGLLGYFPDLTPEQLSSGLKQNYETAMWTAHQATIRMVKNKIQGKIVFVSSGLGLVNFIGFNAYAPAKHAMRGLADGLRNELKLYGITVHCYFPASIATPGFEAENADKPKLTAEIEGQASVQTPEQCAAALIKGLERGQFFIANDLIVNLLRASGSGISPATHMILDPIYRIIGAIGLPIFRIVADRQVTQSPEAKAYRASCK